MGSYNIYPYLNRPIPSTSLREIILPATLEHESFCHNCIVSIFFVLLHTFYDKHLVEQNIQLKT